MQEERFNQIVEAQIDIALSMFQKKNDSYSGTQIEDRLAGVKGVAAVRGCSNLEAISGMMAKHTMSIYSMMRDGKDHPVAVWNEKISDHINYLLLTAACVHEELDQRTEENLANGEDPDRGVVYGVVNNYIGQPDDLNEIELRLKKHFEEKK